jgi:hypothetical protein
MVRQLNYILWDHDAKGRISKLFCSRTQALGNGPTLTKLLKTLSPTLLAAFYLVWSDSIY